MASQKFFSQNPGFREGYAEVNGVRLHYVARGEGKLMLFLHGFPEFWYEWKAQLEDFGRDHLAVAVDLRGYNLSSKPEDVRAYRPQDITEDIRQLAHRQAEVVLEVALALLANEFLSRRVDEIVGPRQLRPMAQFAGGGVNAVEDDPAIQLR